MAKKIQLEPTRTYATMDNAEKAIDRFPAIRNNDKLRYFIHTHSDGRFFPVFLGEDAIQAGVHFQFNVIG